MQSNKLLLFIAALILVLNFTLISKINDLHNEVNATRQDYNNLQMNLGSISGNINNELDRFIREQSWISPVEINDEKSKIENNQVIAVLNWQIKDYQEGAKVLFHYRLSESEEFKVVNPEDKGGGFYEISLPVDVKVEPRWDLNVSKTTTGDARKTAAAPNIKIVEEAPFVNPSMGYYVSMSINKNTKSSAMDSFNFDYLAHTKYEPIQGHVDIDNNKCHISLFEHSSSISHYQSVTARFYDGNDFLGEMDVPVEKTDRHGDADMKVYSLSYDAGEKKISHLELQVKFTNGEIFNRVF